MDESVQEAGALAGDQRADATADVTSDEAGSAGDPRVDAALAALDDVDGLDLSAQLDVFTDLQAALALILDSPQGGEAPPGLDADGGSARTPAP